MGVTYTRMNDLLGCIDNYELPYTITVVGTHSLTSNGHDNIEVIIRRMD